MENTLHPISGKSTDECDRCHDVKPGWWYSDDDSAGSEWFYCNACAGIIERSRKENTVKGGKQ